MILLLYLSVVLAVEIDSPGSIRIEAGKNGTFEISSENDSNSYYVYTEHKNKTISLHCSSGSLQTLDCLLNWNKTGKFSFSANSISQDFLRFNDSNATWSKTKFQVIKSEGLYIFNEIIGWVYFLAWTVSFYPQIILNVRRRSVAGLNFDYCTLNIIGFACYSAYNLALFTSDKIFDQYEEKHPDGVNPVLPNDIFFSVHAFAASAFTGFQIIVYERDNQRISYAGGAFAVLCILTAAFGCIPPAVGAITWLDYLTILSSIKLAITIVKYCPQAYMNFKRKSTDGWSIGNVLLDLTGGSFSLLQMLLQGLNNNQFSNIFGDPTKFGLGVFSILFDCLFIVQHYCLYKDNLPYVPQMDDHLID